MKQCIAVIVSAIWASGFTFGVLWLIDQITPVKLDSIIQEHGLDEEELGEEAYTAGL